MPLTELQLRSATPKAKSYRMADGQGLCVEVTPSGSLLYRLRYRWKGKERLLALGRWPDVKLAEARRHAAEAKDLLASGVDPNADRKAEKQRVALGAANTFEVVARDWHKRTKAHLMDVTVARNLMLLERDAFPVVGDMPIGELTASDMLKVLRRIEARGAAEVAIRTWNVCGRVFRFGVASGMCQRDPTRDIELKDLIRKPPTKHRAAITEPKEVGALMRAIDGYTGSFVVKAALQFLPLVFVRPGELREATWDQIDLDRAEWRYHVTKTKTEHLVPLSPKAVAILRQVHAVTGEGKYVFPSERQKTRPLSENTLLAALRRLGYSTEEMCAHGFRAMARTLLHEELNYDPAIIEHQLAHKVPDALGAAYNRTKFIKDRVAMMEAYSDYLDKLKAEPVK